MPAEFGNRGSDPRKPPPDATHTPHHRPRHAPAPARAIHVGRARRPIWALGKIQWGSEAILRDRELRVCLHGGAVSRFKIKLVILRGGTKRQIQFCGLRQP